MRIPLQPKNRVLLVDPRSILTLALIGAAMASPVAAQEVTADTKPVPTATPATTTSDAAVVLSPFQVTSDTDKGYQATSTLSGTWINTSYKDITASISAVTKNMMDDLGATNSMELLNYTLGTEVSGPYGNYSGTTFGTSYDFDAVDRSLLPQVRIRGLSTADNTRNLFPSSIPWDSFDVERVEVERGPNAMLFGTGSPAGIINQTTVTPTFDRNKGTLTFEYGSFGSSREELDANEILIPDKASIRVGVKNSEDRFMQQEAYIKDKRLYLAGQFNVLKYTILRANAEYGNQESVKPEWRPPYDDGVSYFYQVGQPAFNPLTYSVKLNAPVTGPASAANLDGSVNTNIITGYQTSWSAAPALIFAQPNAYGSNIYGMSGTSIGAVTNVIPAGAYTNGLLALPISANYEQYIHQNVIGGGAWQPQEINNPSIFDFYDHMLEGANKTEGARWDVYNVSLEQDLPDHSGGIQLAYNEEKVLSSFNNPLNWATYGITMDINSVLLNGQPNPNYGRPMIVSDSWSTASLERRTDKRAVAFYTLDTKKYVPDWLGRILGTHSFTGTYNDATDFNDTAGGRALVAGPDWFSSGAFNLGSGYLIDQNNAPRAFSSVVYLGNAGSSPTSLGIKPVSVNIEPGSITGGAGVPVTYYSQAAGGFTTSNISVESGSEFDKSDVDIAGWTGADTKTEISSQVAILHSTLLYDALVTTVGVRTDNFSAWQGGNPIIVDGGYAEDKGPLPPTPTSTETQHATNWGAILRLPDFLASKTPYGLEPGIFYNKADNFSPTAQRYDIFGNPEGPERGVTHEYGFMLGALGGKFNIRFTHYETSLTGVSIDNRDAIHSLIRDGIGGALQQIADGDPSDNAAAVQAFQSWWATSPLAANIKKTYQFNVSGTTVSDVSLDGEVLQTQDTVSRGNEVEVTFNPTNNWRIGANLDKESVMTANTAKDAESMLNQIEPILNGPAGQVAVYPGQNAETWQQLAQTFVNTINTEVYQDGEPANPELRQWRFNLVTNYEFDRGPLKRVGIGAGYRWQSKVLIGTGYMVNPNGGGAIPDYSKEYWGPAESSYDGWVSYRVPHVFKDIDWKIQLNVANIGVGKELIPAQADPDGSIAAWRIRDPMTWTFKSEFAF